MPRNDAPVTGMIALTIYGGPATGKLRITLDPLAVVVERFSDGVATMVRSDDPAVADHWTRLLAALTDGVPHAV